MPKFVRTFPVVVEFYWESEERETEFEPCVEEWFDLETIKICGTKIECDDNVWKQIEDAIYE